MQNMNIRTSQGGFTLIELVIVIVILGILAAVAVPRYIDLQSEATTASCDGVEGAIYSTAAITIAEQKTTPTISQIEANFTSAGGAAVTFTACDDVSITLDDGNVSCPNDPDLAASGLCTT